MRNLLALAFLFALSTQVASALERDASIDGWWENNEGPQVRINNAPRRFSGLRIYFATRGRRLCMVENEYFAGVRVDSILYMGDFFNGRGQIYEKRILATAVTKREWKFAEPMGLYVGVTHLILRKVPPKEKGYPVGTFNLLLQRTTQIQTSAPDYSGGFVPDKVVPLVNEENVCKKELSFRPSRASGKKKSRE